MESQPFFSIVVPVYNVEKYLASALGDLRSQTFLDWEAIIVDDASPDGSRNIAQSFVDLDPRFRIVSHDTNRGLSAARNTGIDEAKGKYIWFPDPDDRYSCLLLETVANTIQEQGSSVVLVGHTENYFDHRGKIYKKRNFQVHGGSFDKQSLRKLVLCLELNTQYGYAWNKIYSATYIKKNNLMFESNLPLIEDIIFNIQAFQNLSRLSIVEDSLYFYSKREKGNLTNKYVPNYYQLHRQRIKLLRNQLSSWNLLSNEAKGVLGVLFARYILSALERNCSYQCNFSHHDRLKWCNQVTAEPLFDELVMKAQSDSKVVCLCIKILQTKNAHWWVSLGRILYLFKKGAFHRIFLSLKAKR